MKRKTYKRVEKKRVFFPEVKITLGSSINFIAYIKSKGILKIKRVFNTTYGAILTLNNYSDYKKLVGKKAGSKIDWISLLKD